MQHESHVIPESPKEPADSSTNACTNPTAGPGRTSASQPFQDRQDIPFIKEAATGHDAAEAPCALAQPAANQTPPLPAASNPGILSDEHLDISRQPLHLHGSSVPAVTEACKQTECAGCQATDNAYQPAEFDIVVDAHPAGKSTS